MLAQSVVGPFATLVSLGPGPGTILLLLVGGILGGTLSQGVTGGYIRAGERANAAIACCSVGWALAVFAYAQLWHRIEDNFDQFPWRNVLTDRPAQRKQLMVAPCPFSGLVTPSSDQFRNLVDYCLPSGLSHTVTACMSWPYYICQYESSHSNSRASLRVDLHISPCTSFGISRTSFCNKLRWCNFKCHPLSSGMQASLMTAQCILHWSLVRFGMPPTFGTDVMCWPTMTSVPQGI